MRDEIDEKLRTLLVDIADLLQAISKERKLADGKEKEEVKPKEKTFSEIYHVTPQINKDAVPPEKQTMTVPQAAAYLGVSTPVVYTLIHRADFPVLKLGRRRVIPRALFEKWIAEHINENLEV